MPDLEPRSDRPYAGVGERIYDLSHPLEPSMPVSPNHPGYRMALLRRHGDLVRANGDSAANELLVLGGHTGTHIDGLAHVSRAGHLYGGIDAAEAQRGGRFGSLGVETIAPIFGRGILLDIAGHRQVPALAPAEPITADDLQAVADAHGLDPSGATAIMVRSGWARHWGEPARYLGRESGVPGPDVSAAAWLSATGPVVVGHDSMAFEQLEPGAGHVSLPVHGALIAERGIHILENVNLEALAADGVHEFLFVCLPLPFVGATGSPVRPIAVVGSS
jgi:kynurenine formamidase